MKRIKLVFIMMLTMLLLVACAQDGEEEVTKKSESVAPSIGFCFDTYVVERWIKDRDVFTYTASQLGENVEVLNANGEVEKQREQLKHFIDSDVKVILLVAVNADEEMDLIEQAHKKGIKVIAYDRMIESEYVDLYISFDNLEVGRIMGDTVAQAFEESGNTEKNVLMICGPNEDKNVVSVEEGFMPIAREHNFNILDTFHATGWRAETVDTYYEEHKELFLQADAIMCGNDNLAGAVVQILAENRMAGDVIVTGQDADLEACQRIVEKTQAVTVYKAVEQLAKQAAELAVKMAHNEDITDVCSELMLENGKLSYVALPVQAVNEENMESIIIDSGFHLKEDIYLNVNGR